jgi:hypothetical protein
MYSLSHRYSYCSSSLLWFHTGLEAEEDDWLVVSRSCWQWSASWFGASCEEHTRACTLGPLQLLVQHTHMPVQLLPNTRQCRHASVTGPALHLRQMNCCLVVAAHTDLYPLLKGTCTKHHYVILHWSWVAYITVDRSTQHDITHVFCSAKCFSCKDTLVNAPWYVRNSDLHCDLGIETVTDIIAKFAKSHEKRLQDHMNIEASRLLNVNNITRRLKRRNRLN